MNFQVCFIFNFHCYKLVYLKNSNIAGKILTAAKPVHGDNSVISWLYHSYNAASLYNYDSVLISTAAY